MSQHLCSVEVWRKNCFPFWTVYCFPGGSDGKSICLQCGRPEFDPKVGKITWRRKWQPTPVLLPGKFHRWRSLIGCSPWDRKELHTTERLHFLTFFLFWTITICIADFEYASCTSLAFEKRFSSVQSLSHVRLFATPWIAALQASLSITNSQSSPKLMSIESVMPSSHLILCRPLLFLPPVSPSVSIFSSESTLRMRWPKYWSFSFSIIPSNEHPGLI